MRSPNPFFPKDGDYLENLRISHLKPISFLSKADAIRFALSGFSLRVSADRQHGARDAGHRLSSPVNQSVPVSKLPGVHQDEAGDPSDTE